jgi:hypothetical protein
MIKVSDPNGFQASSSANLPDASTLTLLQRFARPHQGAIGQLVARSPQMADLLTTFPGMLFALASGFAPQVLTQQACALIESGASLKQVALLLDLPLWLRKLPPEAFAAPLHGIPRGADYSRRIVNHIPEEPWKQAAWFDRTLQAANLCDAEFSAWYAWRTSRAPHGPDRVGRTVLLAAHAWYSQRPDTFAFKLIKRPFDASFSLRRATEMAEAWRRRIDLAIALEGGEDQPWCRPGRSQGYQFVPLKSLTDFLSEAETMDNCLDQYGGKLRTGRVRVFSVRKDGRRIANLELAPHDEESTMVGISQLRGPRNRRVPSDVWQATYAWLGRQRELTIVAAKRPKRGLARDVARAIWEPYLSALNDEASLAQVRAYLRSSQGIDLAS